MSELPNAPMSPSIPMSKAAIALNRFGYGQRIRGSQPADPVRDLLDQMDRYNPAPSQLAGREDTSEKAGEFLQQLRRLRRERQNAAASSGMSEMQEMQRGMTGNPELDGLPPEIRSSYLSSGQILRRDVGLRTNIAVQSDTPMLERLVHFWSNHFSVSAQRPGTHHQVGNHEFRAIRPHVLGKFSNMLKAATLHPAMLLYLDQFQSVGPNSQFQRRRRQRSNRGNGQGQDRGLNENLAREILELHTLGVGGGYDQSDVTEFARALTGWTIQGLTRAARFAEAQTTGAAFISVAHEPGTRTIMGKTYRDNGSKQAVAILDDLA
ncbi:MAG: DUF1800 family protein, partial [Pseudomonadota bacterium]